MTARQAADGQRQRGVFDVDEDRALEALRLAWGDAYAVCFDDAVSAAVGGGRHGAWAVTAPCSQVTRRMS